MRGCRGKPGGQLVIVDWEGSEEEWLAHERLCPLHVEATRRMIKALVEVGIDV